MSVRVIKSEAMGKSDHDWLHSRFHFSFADYCNPDNIRFGSLRVVNDDTFDPRGGFPTHPHENMEIISYVVDGKLTHKDSLGNGHTLGRGDVQYMSAGTGITHSEFNNTDDPLRFLQIWILPDRAGYTPNYGDHRYPWEDRAGTWLLIASGKEGSSPVLIHQDMDLSVATLEAGEELSYSLGPDRQAYFIQIEGEGSVNGSALSQGDAVELRAETSVTIQAKTFSHVILFDMPVD